MTCADFEILICDYVDGTLAADRRTEVERHLAQCEACAELAHDSAAAVAFIERADTVEPPPELVTRILFDAPWNVEKAASRKRSWVAALLGPVWQPRIVMGMAMTFLSFSMLFSFMKPSRPLQASDLKPAAVWIAVQNRADYAWTRTMAFFDHLKIVYQIQTAVQKLQQQDDDQPAADQPGSKPKSDDHKLPVKSSPVPGSAAPPATGGSH